MIVTTKNLVLAQFREHLIYHQVSRGRQFSQWELYSSSNVARDSDLTVIHTYYCRNLCFTCHVVLSYSDLSSNEILSVGSYQHSVAQGDKLIASTALHVGIHNFRILPQDTNFLVYVLLSVVLIIPSLTRISDSKSCIFPKIHLHQVSLFFHGVVNL